MKIKHIKNTFIKAIFAASCLWLSGCASIITSGDRRVPITSNPSAATVTIFDTGNNLVATGTTPTIIKLKKGAGYFQGADYRLVVAKTGYQSQEFQLKHNINGWYFGNFFLGGILGLVIVDPITGGMWVLKPDHIDAELKPSTVSLNDQKLTILTKDQLTSEERNHLVAIQPGLSPVIQK